MPAPRPRTHLCCRCGVAFAGLLALGPVVAHADQLDAEVADDERGYYPVQELSYEAIVDPGDEPGNLGSHVATLRLRVALHNGSGNRRDAVHMLAVPSGAELVGLQAARDGVWKPGVTTSVLAEAGQRDVETIWARMVEPTSAADQPAVELVAFGLAAEVTVQVEVVLRVFPTLRNGRWELDLPSHGPSSPALTKDRRVLVRGLPTGKQFWVDDRANGTEPAMTTDALDTATVAWPAKVREPGELLVRYDVTPGPAGFDDGRFRVVLRAGSTPAPIPDHVTFVVDRSRSTAPLMHRDTSRVVTALLDALPDGATFDAVGFARTPSPLLGPDATAHAVDDAAARERLATVLDANTREQGTDLAAALTLASSRLREVSAKRPMIIVFTDGMLPATLESQALKSAVGSAPRGRRPELLFVVDDPLFARNGLPASHPVATAAAALGARISLEALAQVEPDQVLELLAAPRVLGDLQVQLGPDMHLDAPAPAGLVAGNVVVLRGQYQGMHARHIAITGRAGGRKVSRKVKPTVGAEQAEAFVVATSGDVESSRGEGLVKPTWLRPRQQRTAREGIAQAGRGRQRDGYLDEKIFRNYLTTRVVPRARACYNRALSRSPDQGGRVVLEMEVGKGEVMHAAVREPSLVHEDAGLVACLTEAAWALDVPAAKMDERVYVIRYPLRMVAPTEGMARGRVEAIDSNLIEVLLAQPVVPIARE
jgi:Mg-chelatase subunit ChlD